MADRLFQYQSRAEPVLVPAAAEDVTADKWLSQHPTPVRSRRPTAEGFAVAPVGLANFVVPGEWDRPQSVPTPAARRAATGTGVGPLDTSAPAETPFDWLREAVLPARRHPPRPAGGTVGSPEPTLYETPPLDWLVPCAVWMRPRATLPGGVEGGVYVGEPAVLPVPPVAAPELPGGTLRRADCRRALDRDAPGNLLRRADARRVFRPES